MSHISSGVQLRRRRSSRGRVGRNSGGNGRYIVGGLKWQGANLLLAVGVNVNTKMERDTEGE